MGKAKRKLNRDQMKRVNGQENKIQEQRKRELQTQMMNLIKVEEYAKALNVLAEVIEQKIYDPELMYQGANCYFMTGDYERAIQWIDNTLQFEPNHVAARLLLARICILEDRAKDGLAIYDFILEHYLAVLKQEQREDVADILEYYARNESDMIRQDFPYISKFMHLDDDLESAVTAISVHQVDNTSIARLDDDKEDAQQEDHDVQQKIQQVEQMDASVIEKIHILNAFAGGWFYADAYEAAQEFLAAALKLDTHHDETLRNLAVLAGVTGDSDRALEYVSAMSSTDFVLLQALKVKG